MRIKARAAKVKTGTTKAKVKARTSPHGAQGRTERAKAKSQPLMIGQDRPELGRKISHGAFSRDRMSRGCRLL